MHNLDLFLWLKSLTGSKQLLIMLLLSVVLLLLFLLFGKKEGEAVFDHNDLLQDSNQITQTQETPTYPTSGDIYVDIGGAVNKPGIYKLTRGAHLADLVKASGGVTEETASAQWFLKYVNLAKTLENEQKVYIPFDWEVYESTQSIVDLSSFPIITPTVSEATTQPTAKKTTPNDTTTDTTTAKTSTTPKTNTTINENSTKPTSTPAALINVNTADSKTLETLPGIGPAYAEKIIQNRPYTSLTDLKTKAKLSDSLINKLKDAITF